MAVSALTITLMLVALTVFTIVTAVDAIPPPGVDGWCISKDDCPQACQRCNNNTSRCEVDPAIQCGRPVDAKPVKVSPILPCLEVKCGDKCRVCNPVNGKCEPLVCKGCQKCNNVSGICEVDPAAQCGISVTPSCGIRNSFRCDPCQYCNLFQGQCVPIKCLGCGNKCDVKSNTCVPDPTIQCQANDQCWFGQCSPGKICNKKTGLCEYLPIR